MRGVREEAVFRQLRAFLSEKDPSALESEHPAGEGSRQRVPEAGVGLHRLSQGRQGRQGGPWPPPRRGLDLLQGVIKAYDPATGEGSILRESDRAELDLASDALAGSIFRMLRQGQRVVFDLDAAGKATRLRLGSEVDMGTPPPPPGES